MASRMGSRVLLLRFRRLLLRLRRLLGTAMGLVMDMLEAVEHWIQRRVVR
jgi:hypothetical protein